MGRWETELLAAFPSFLRSLSCREFLTPCFLPLGRVEGGGQGFSQETIMQGLPNSGAWSIAEK